MILTSAPNLAVLVNTFQSLNATDNAAHSPDLRFRTLLPIEEASSISGSQQCTSMYLHERKEKFGQARIER